MYRDNKRIKILKGNYKTNVHTVPLQGIIVGYAFLMLNCSMGHT